MRCPFPEGRRLLRQWLLANTTGGKRLKADLGKNWRIGEKTGTSRSDANDIGVAWPPDRGPVLITAYLADSKASPEAKDATLAQVGSLLMSFA